MVVHVAWEGERAGVQAAGFLGGSGDPAERQAALCIRFCCFGLNSFALSLDPSVNGLRCSDSSASQEHGMPHDHRLATKQHKRGS